MSPDGNHIAFLGNHGTVLLVSLVTKKLVGMVKMNGSVRAIAFSADGAELYSIGGTCAVTWQQSWQQLEDFCGVSRVGSQVGGGLLLGRV